MQIRLLENILIFKYVESNGCFAARTGLLLHANGYGCLRPEAETRKWKFSPFFVMIHEWSWNY